MAETDAAMSSGLASARYRTSQLVFSVFLPGSVSITFLPRLLEDYIYIYIYIYIYVYIYVYMYRTSVE